MMTTPAHDLPAASDVESVQGEWLIENIEFAYAVMPELQLSARLISELASSEDSQYQCDDAESQAVFAVLADQMIDKLTALRGWDGSIPDDEWARCLGLQTALLADMDRLTAFLGDEYDNRIISALAAAIRDQGGVSFARMFDNRRHGALVSD